MLKEAGELQSLLSNNLYDYTSLTLAGQMNGDDLNCLRKMMGRNLDESDTPGKLASIDMTDVKIVAGGGPYGANRYVQDHVIGQGLLPIAIISQMLSYLQMSQPSKRMPL